MTTRAEHLEYVARMAELGEVNDDWIIEQVRIAADLPTETDKAKQAFALQLEQKAAKLEAEQKAAEVLKDVDESDPEQLRKAAETLRQQA